MRGGKAAIKGLSGLTELSNDDITLVVDHFGAKVLALYFQGENILFYDETDISHSGIPLCFPNFGPLKNGVLLVDGEKYPMKQHGFIRDSIFQLSEQGTDTLKYTLKSDEDFLRVYPYEFNFSVEYKILANGLKISLSMKNDSQRTMYLAPGVHPYFSIEDPQDVNFTTRSESANDNKNNYRKIALRDCDVFVEKSVNKGVKTMQVCGAPDIHLIEHNLFETIIYPGNNRILTVKADQSVFNRLAVWRRKADSRYICIEPSYVGNGINEAALEVPPGECFSTDVEILVSICD